MSRMTHEQAVAMANEVAKFDLTSVELECAARGIQDYLDKHRDNEWMAGPSIGQLELWLKWIEGGKHRLAIAYKEIGRLNDQLEISVAQIAELSQVIIRQSETRSPNTDRD